MLKKRVIPIQLLKNGRLVKGVQFNDYRDVGDPVASSGVYNSQLADELIFLNTNGELGIRPLLDIIDDVANVVFMPISFGGGVRTFEDAAALIKHGADKVVLNSICYRNKALVSDIANHFGNQAVVACIDVRIIDGRVVLFSENGTRRESISLEQHIKELERAGTGEIMLQSIDRDGSMTGFDLALSKHAAECSSIPVILAGGSGNYEQLKEAFFAADISAVACGSLFNFSDSNPMRALSYLRNYDLPFKKV